MSTLTQTTAIPFTTDPNELLEHLWATHGRSLNPNIQEAENAFHRVATTSWPAIVQEIGTMMDSDFAAPLLERMVPQAWSGPEYPERLLDAEEWFWLFSDAGFTVDGAPAPRPRGRRRLYRGCTPAGIRGMSWTTDLEVARSFAEDELRGRPQGQIYTALVPPSCLLARIDDRGEGEFVVRTDDLVIEELASA